MNVIFEGKGERENEMKKLLIRMNGQRRINDNMRRRMKRRRRKKRRRNKEKLGRSPK